jgi:hypothetical protein
LTYQLQKLAKDSKELLTVKSQENPEGYFKRKTVESLNQNLMKNVYQRPSTIIFMVIAIEFIPRQLSSHGIAVYNSSLSTRVGRWYTDSPAEKIQEQ